MIIKKKIFARVPVRKLPGGGIMKISQNFTGKGNGILNKSLKRQATLAAGAKVDGVPQYISSTGGKTIINPQYNSRSVLRSGRGNDVFSKSTEAVTNANLGKGKASVHDRINLRASSTKGYKGDHLDLESTFAFEGHGHKPIRNLDRGYNYAFGQEIIGNASSFKNNKALQNLGVVPKPKKWWW